MVSNKIVKKKQLSKSLALICHWPWTRSTDSISIDKVKTIIIVEEDECRLIQFLMSGTVIDTRINGTSKSKPFTSNVRSRQGDSLKKLCGRCVCVCSSIII